MVDEVLPRRKFYVPRRRDSPLHRALHTGLWPELFWNATFLELEENLLIARCLCNVSGASRLARSLHQ